MRKANAFSEALYRSGQRMNSRQNESESECDGQKRRYITERQQYFIEKKEKVGETISIAYRRTELGNTRNDVTR